MRLSPYLCKTFFALTMAAALGAQQTDNANAQTNTRSSTTSQSQTGQQPRTGVVETPQTDARTTDRGTASGTRGKVGDPGERATLNPAGGTGAAATESMLGETDQRFLDKVAMGSVAEVHAARLALTKSNNEAVKSYARKIEQDHTKATEELSSIAKDRGVSLPTTMAPEHQKEMTKLESLSGDQFDKQFIKMMVKDHKKHVSEFEKYGNRGIDSSLKSFAEKTLPALRSHLTDAQTVSADVSGRGTRSRSGSNSSGSASDVPREANQGQKPATESNPTPKP